MNTNLIFRTLRRVHQGMGASQAILHSQILRTHNFELNKPVASFCTNKGNQNDPKNNKESDEEKDWKERFQERIKDFNSYCD